MSTSVQAPATTPTLPPVAGTEPKNAATRWKPGQSGNPTGKPKVPRDLVEQCRALTSEAVKVMESVMRNTKASPGVRLQAASLILDRAWGKPAQTVDLTVRRAVSEMSDSDLLALLHEARSRAGLDEPPTIDVTPAP